MIPTNHLRVLYGAIYSGASSWRTIERTSTINSREARKARDELVASGGLIVDRCTVLDAASRRFRRTYYRANPEWPEVVAIAAWVDGGQREPLPLLARTPIAPRPKAQLDPAQHRHDDERVLTAILRNPRQPWRAIRQTVSLPTRRSDIARSELLDAGHIYGGGENLPTATGKLRFSPRLFPNEDSPLVQELRKRFGIPMSSDTTNLLGLVMPVTKHVPVPRAPRQLSTLDLEERAETAHERAERERRLAVPPIASVLPMPRQRIVPPPKLPQETEEYTVARLTAEMHALNAGDIERAPLEELEDDDAPSQDVGEKEAPEDPEACDIDYLMTRFT